MNRREFIEAYLGLTKQLGIKPEQMPVDAGGSLLMRGMRTATDDIDTSVESDVYMAIKLKVKPWFYYEDLNHPSGLKVLSIGPFDIHLVKQLPKRCDIIDGVGCQTLEDVLALKKRLNRPKDQDDIRAIEAALAAQHNK